MVIILELSDNSYCILQPTSISENASTHRPMLVIVQNPSMSDIAFTENFDKGFTKPKEAFTNSPNFQKSSASLALAASPKSHDSSTDCNFGYEAVLKSRGVQNVVAGETTNSLGVVSGL